MVGSQEDQRTAAALTHAIQSREQLADEVICRAERPQIADIVAPVGVFVRFTQPHEEEGGPPDVQVSECGGCRKAIRTEAVRAGVRVGVQAFFESLLECGIA